VSQVSALNPEARLPRIPAKASYKSSRRHKPRGSEGGWLIVTLSEEAEKRNPSHLSSSLGLAGGGDGVQDAWLRSARAGSARDVLITTTRDLTEAVKHCDASNRYRRSIHLVRYDAVARTRPPASSLIGGEEETQTISRDVREYHQNDENAPVAVKHEKFSVKRRETDKELAQRLSQKNRGSKKI